MPLDENVVRLAHGKNLATVVTLMPDGQPQALPRWVDSDDEYVLVNTEPTRQAAKNVERDPRVTVLIHSAEDPWDWAEVRGHVVEVVGGQEARDHIDKLSNKYVGTDYTQPDRTEGPHHPAHRGGQDEYLRPPLTAAAVRSQRGARAPRSLDCRLGRARSRRRGPHARLADRARRCAPTDRSDGSGPCPARSSTAR